MTASTVTRPKATHHPSWQRFQNSLTSPSCEETVYQRQYAHVYHQRLADLAPRCWKKMQGAFSAKRILEVQEAVESLLVGTLVREKADLYIEDESGRVALLIDNSKAYCTGLVAGLRGILGEDGVFKVSEIFTPSLQTLSPGMDATGPQPQLLLLSGIHCESGEVSPVARDLLVDFVRGQFGVNQSKQIAHVLVAGGLVPPESKELTSSLKDATTLLNQMAATGVPVDVLPSEYDPTTANWPQRPVHPSLLPGLLPNVNRAPNPYAARIEESLIVGSDGKNTRDLTRKVEKDGKSVSELDALHMTLHWCHLCPTGPDSVPTIPHGDSDPMVLTERPRLLFSGNCKEFATSKEKETRCVCIPTFASTGKAVLVNLHTLEVEVLQFEC